jgi:hypothetical protein
LSKDDRVEERKAERVKRKRRRDADICDAKCNAMGSHDVWIGAMRRSTTHATGSEDSK